MNFGNWIPHLFYDLIGRIIPGSILLFLAYFVLQPSSIDGNWASLKGFLLDEHLNGAIVVMGAIAFSYIIGILLGGVMYLFDPQFWNWGKDNTNEPSPQPEEAYGRFNTLLSRFFFPSIPLNGGSKLSEAEAYDFILANHGEVGARLAKLSAERHLGRTIMGGTFILMLCNILLRFDGNWIRIIELTLVGVLLFLSLWTARKETLLALLAKGGVFTIFFLLPLFLKPLSSDFSILHIILTAGFIAALTFRRHIKIRSQFLIRNNMKWLLDAEQKEEKAKKKEKP